MNYLTWPTGVAPGWTSVVKLSHRRGRSPIAWLLVLVMTVRLRAAVIYIIMAQTQVQLSATGLEGQNMDGCYAFDSWAEAQRRHECS